MRGPHNARILIIGTPFIVGNPHVGILAITCRLHRDGQVTVQIFRLCLLLPLVCDLCTYLHSFARRRRQESHSDVGGWHPESFCNLRAVVDLGTAYTDITSMSRKTKPLIKSTSFYSCLLPAQVEVRFVVPSPTM